MPSPTKRGKPKPKVALPKINRDMEKAGVGILVAMIGAEGRIGFHNRLVVRNIFRAMYMKQPANEKRRRDSP